MAQLGNLLVKGSSRFLNKVYFEDISIAGTSFFSGNISTDGTLNIGANKASNALLYLNKKIAIRGVDSWLGINDTSTNFTSGVYFGSSDVRTDKAFQVGDDGKYFKINSSSLEVNVPSAFSQRTTHNGGLISPTISSNLISFVKNGNTLPKIDGADATAILNELTVLSTLRAKEYELDHVQNLGGTFMVSPSFICTEGSTSVTVSAISGSEVTFVIKDNATLTKTEIATASWVLNSQIKLSGKIGNAILANATGTITKSVDTNNHTITVKVDVGSSTVGNFTVNTTYSGSQVSKLAFMMFRNASGYRLGIYLESYSSENKKPVINIFDGSGTDPKVVLGKLDGTPKVNNVSPTGYGLYSDNAFLKGTIIATSGTIGGFTLSTDSIQNGTFGQDGSVMMCLGSNNSASIGGSGNINGWTFTAGSKFGVTKNGAMYATSGKIGKYTITDSCLTTGGGSVCTGMGGDQAFWAGSDSSNDAPFHVSYDGSLYASKANISGVINSTDGSIGGWKIENSSIYVRSIDGLKQTSLNSDSQKIEFKLTKPASTESDESSSFLNISNSNLSPYIELGWMTTDFDGNAYWGNRTYISEDSIAISSKADIDSSVTISSYDIVLSSVGNKLTIRPGYLQFENGGSISPDCLEFKNGVKISQNQNVLWSGADYINENQKIELNGNNNISKQLSGICLAFTHYDPSNNKVGWYGMHYYFVPKSAVAVNNGGGTAFTDLYRGMNKYLYIYNDKILGTKQNGEHGSENGFSYDNRNWVLVRVFGV